MKFFWNVVLPFKSESNPPLGDILLRLIFIPLIGLVLILLFMTIYQAKIVTDDINKGQKNQINALGQITEQYLSETAQTMHALGHIMSGEDDTEKQSHLLQLTHENYPRFSAFYFTNAEGIVTLDATKKFQITGLDLSGEPFFQEVKQTRGDFISDPFVSLATGHITVTAATPVQKNGQLMGILAGELDLSYLQNVIEQVNANEEGEVFILDRAGNVIAYPNPTIVEERRNLSNLPLIEQCKANKTAFGIYFDEDEKKWMMGSAATITHDWIVVAAQPVYVVMRPVFILAGIILFIAIVGTSLLSWVLARSRDLVLQPIHLLTQNADLLATGKYDLEQIHDVVGFAELASLSQDFKRMAEAIQQRTIEMEYTNEKLQEQIHERMEAEDLVRQLNAGLEERVRARTAELQDAIQELESSSYTISHDLRAPLRSIHGYMSILLEDFSDQLPADAIEYIKKVRDNARLMGEMVDDLLTFLRLNRINIQKRKVNIEQLANQVFNDLLENEPRERKIIFICDPAPICLSDPELLRQALQALISNAIKFTRTRETAQIHVGSMLQGEQVIYFVRDNGIGFDMRFSNKLFGVFQHLHSPSGMEGRGAGLAIVQRIIQKHGGKIWAEAEIDKGATFFFTLG